MSGKGLWPEMSSVSISKENSVVSLDVTMTAAWECYMWRMHTADKDLQHPWKAI